MIWAWLLGCTGAPPAPQAATGNEGDTLVIALPFDPGNVHPLVLPYQASGYIQELVLPGLVLRTVDAGGLAFEPGLAESWEWSTDGKALTYRLRDLKWEDGKPITSEDLRFTRELIADEKVASNWAGDALRVVDVETPDVRTAIFHFDTPRRAALQQSYTLRGIVPKHILETADRSTMRGHPFGRAPTASGPFRIAQWKPNEKIVLEPNPAAPKDWQPHLDRIVFRVIPEYATRLLELQNGGVDMLLDVETKDVNRLSTNDHLSILSEPNAGMQYIGYNLRQPRFQDQRVRRALTLGLDREGLVKELLSDGAEVHGRTCVGTISPTFSEWYADQVIPLPFDPTQAARLLDEAGWTRGSDGVRSKDGKPLQFALMVQTGNQQYQEIAVRTQAAWEKLGVRMTIDQVEPVRFADLARNKEYDAILWGFGANAKLDPSIEWRSDGQYNWFGYQNSEVDRHLDAAVGALEKSDAQHHLKEVQRLIHEDQPITCLFWGDRFQVIDKRFQGVQTNPFNALFHAERWNVPAADQKYQRR